MSSRTLSSVAVVTVTYNSSTIIAEFLASVRDSEETPPPVWVIDNDSSDWRETEVIALSFGAHFQNLGENRGYGGAVNAAVHSLPSDITAVLISNPDLTVATRAISTLVAALVEAPTSAAAGPRVLNPDGSVYPSARNQPSLRTGIGHALFSGIWPGNPWSRTYRQELPTFESSRREVGWLSGACLAVDRDAFSAVGGFDEDFFMYFEDVELGRRFLHNGYTNLYVPSASVTHLGAHSTRSNSAQMITAHHDSAYLFLSKRYSGPLYAPLRLALRIALRVRAGWQSVRTR
ncbi:N-acetylglucosaminyl-diphospho-decaprenol L-rhamnosyltransferase [Glaciihabitans tibetensis]|uniref:N-acetylglucosaminyl-diphospho-decaprenol L-rhamnosyltransferase n=1 Tax=Glaciihabitans tibetensis TaxID=1266600 RepID=A0A2T0VFB1_9MICO|nr:glycosyltransferase family 2 protein [Glaciihabitans tibetensis]PRY68889.1 N-acetylglucosaminyl-diphospho-decaprenol L-rhamnosyltransferase [Glaciihabitans tibetensis]